MANIVETREYPQQNGNVTAKITDDGACVLIVTGHAGLSAAVLRQLADAVDKAEGSTPLGSPSDDSFG